MLFKLIKLIMLAFFLLASEQVFAHTNHAFFEPLDNGYEQSFFDESSEPDNIMANKLRLKNLNNVQADTSSEIKQNKLVDILLTNVLLTKNFVTSVLQKSIVFQNHILLQQVSKNTHQDEKIADDDCNCLNDCACLDYQCANCPMTSSCNGTSVMLLNNILAAVQPSHEKSVNTIVNAFISQPHTLLLRPPISA